ncbi:RRP15-like protein [Caerostris darwini]|uniref:RRP15-like protein n=1 Tax=Caerostris darwini TaxID=1538125 RepID=A0AAV4PEN2_9ARAC|nr:RRP15-like protein [Caerostris darwini]
MEQRIEIEDSDVEMGASDNASDNESDLSERNEDEINENDMENFADESSDDDRETVKGNAGWADAMSKVLHSSNCILSKAKKDIDVVIKEKQIELVNETGQVIKKEPKQKIFSEKKKEVIERQKLKEWESMCRVKPDIRNKDRERELIRIATGGVVQLFNSVEKHQKTLKTSKKKQKEKKLSVVKGNFMDILRECTKKEKTAEENPVVKKEKQEETWSILKDDFMMGANMKDWDKNDEDT